MTNIPQRDAFFGRLYEIARADTEVVIISADMGARALDRIRRDLPGQFINAGIAEQNATTLAAGLALTGKKVFTYAIAPFITLRCLEQIRVENAIMQVPINIVGVGAGFSYEDSGPTHHLIEDMAIMRAMPNIMTYNITDSVMARSCADICVASAQTNYIRLDRETLPNVHSEKSDFTKGYEVLKESSDVYLLATGNMVHVALQTAGKLAAKNLRVGVVDIFRLPLADGLLDVIKNVRKVITLEEHFLPGGMGSAVCELVCDVQLGTAVKRLGLQHASSYCYNYGGRDLIRGYYGISSEQIDQEIERYLMA